MPRLSATPIEQSGANVEFFAACPHAELQNFDPVRVQARSILQDVDISEIKAVASEPISLEFEDAYHSSQPIVGRARCAAGTEPLEAVIVNAATGAQSVCDVGDDQSSGEWQILKHAPLPAGSYRFRVDAGIDAEPIADVFVVLE